MQTHAEYNEGDEIEYHSSNRFSPGPGKAIINKVFKTKYEVYFYIFTRVRHLPRTRFTFVRKCDIIGKLKGGTVTKDYTE
jgi:hypothetical protein